MSSRELRALLADKAKDFSAITRRTRSSACLASQSSRPDMAGTERVAELETALEEAHQKLAEQKAEFEKAKGEACKKMDEQRDELEKAKRSESQLSQRVREVEMELENSVLRAKITSPKLPAKITSMQLRL